MKRLRPFFILLFFLPAVCLAKKPEPKKKSFQKIQSRTFNNEAELPNIIADSINFYNCKFGSDIVFSFEKYRKIEFIGCSFQNLKIIGKGNERKIDILIYDCELEKSLTINNADLKSLFISNIKIKNNLSLKDLKLYKRTVIHYSNCDSILLQDITYKDSAELYLGRFPNENSEVKKNPLSTDLLSALKLRFNYYGFFQLVNSEIEGEEVESTGAIYYALIDMTKKYNDYNESVNQKLLTREYRHYLQGEGLVNNLTSWVIDQWEDYGSNLPVMLIFSFSILTFFSIINVRVYKMLSQEVYVIQNFNPIITSRNWRKVLENFYYSFVYTANIFINPLIKLDNLRYDYKRRVGLLWVMIIYIFGLILFYYIAHYLIEKNF